MKTKEDLNALKEEVETVSKKLHELTDEELEQVSGGRPPTSIPLIVTATAPVLLKLYDQVNGQVNDESIVDNYEHSLEAYGPAGLPL